MKTFLISIVVLFCTTLLYSQEQDLLAWNGAILAPDSSGPALKEVPGRFHLSALLQKNEPQKTVLLQTKKGRPVELFYFPGLSDKKALVIGGVHGSELSSIEVVNSLIKQLATAAKPYYSVMVIPTLFPDNAAQAIDHGEKRFAGHKGRFSSKVTADPNRQMPLPGKPFLKEKPYDAFQRKIEKETQALLQLIQDYRPDRILTIHAVKDRSKAGVFADPRTDCRGRALGFDTDKALALIMAYHIRIFGGDSPGNRLEDDPTAIYFLDPPAAAAGKKQLRSFQVTKDKGRNKGVTMGTWLSSEVCDDAGEWYRPAIRTLTMEFPGYQQLSEYPSAEDKLLYSSQINVYASSILHYFLHSFFVENHTVPIMPEPLD